MSTKFHSNEFKLQEPSESPGTDRVVKTSKPVETSVRDFRFLDIKKAKVTAAASLRGTADVSDRRFVLSELAREALEVGREEDRIVDERVQAMLAELSENTRKDAFERGLAEGDKLGRTEATRI